MTFCFKTLRDSNVRVAKDYGKKFRSRLVSSFSGIVHWSTIKSRIKEPPFFGVRLAIVLNYGHLTGHFSQTLAWRGAMWSNYGHKSLLVAVQSGEGHVSFTKPFLLTMGGQISGWTFLKFWFFMLVFTVYDLSSYYFTIADYSNVARFLNRILGLTVELQNVLFQYFSDTLAFVITEIKRSGKWDEGILGMHLFCLGGGGGVGGSLRIR